MPKSLRLFLVFGLLVSLPEIGALARRPAPAKTEYRWERMNIAQALPSQVFAKLGLTHTTRYGFTRDGHTKETPDPTFPAGLTDVVPYDVSHLLLVRGTPQGLAQFRRRVLASENEIRTSGRWHLTVELLTGQNGDVAGLSAQQDVTTDVPYMVSVGDPAAPRAYRLQIHVNPYDAAVVSYQIELLPVPGGTPQAVLPPVPVWSPAVAEAVPPQGVVTLDDRASARQSFRRRLNLPAEADAQDYQLRVTVIPPSTRTPAVPGPAATPSPEETNAPPP